MKELSLEEKAKRYDEAIGRANDILKGYNPKEGSKATINYIFPELKENEDERIMTALTHFFSNPENTSFEYWEGISKKEVLDWLEKQGVHANFRRKIQIGDKVTRNKDGILVNISQLDRVAKKDEEQKSNSCNDVSLSSDNGVDILFDKKLVKHISGEEQDEQNLNACLSYIPDESLKRWLMDTIHAKYDKIAWSEEDEKRFKSCLNILQPKTLLGNTETINTKWFKSLKDRYTYKPSSELDEASYQVGIKRVLENPESYGLTKGNWKPSKEQIDSLEYIIDNVQHLPYSCNVAKELLEQLKKLKG